MSTISVYSFIMMPLVALSGFLLPGYLLTRLLPSAGVVLSSFLGSIVMLFWVVLGNQLLGLPLDLTHVGGGIGVAVLVLSLAAWKKKASPAQVHTTNAKPALRADHLLYLTAASLGLASILARSYIDPLSGYDNAFRWNGLGLEMIKTKTLSFYPAVSTEGFAHYAWCDGIPPLVSILNFWMYLGTGSTAPVMTSVRITLEAGLLFLAVFRLSQAIWGSRAAGWAAMGMLATSSLALWAIAMGQETGLTALTLVAMLYFLHAYRKSNRDSDVIWAAIAAAAGALSREYGLAYIILGTAILGSEKPLRLGAPRFLIVSLACALPWYLRNAWITGNPFYSMDLIGLFPVNAAYKTLMSEIIKSCGFSSHSGDLHYLLIAFPVFVGALSLAALMGVFRLRSKSIPLLLAAAVVGMLWLWSVGQTAGGWVYSMRVLTPAIAIAAVLCGGLALLNARIGLICGLSALAFSVDAARRSWHFPTNVLISPWSLSFSVWSKNKKFLNDLETPDLWMILSKAAGDKAIIVDHPSNHVLIRRYGGQAVPLFSPRADCLFDQHQSFADIVAELRRRKVRFIVLIEGSSINDGFCTHYPFLQELRQKKFKVTTVGGLISIYDVEMITMVLRQSHKTATR